MNDHGIEGNDFRFGIGVGFKVFFFVESWIYRVQRSMRLSRLFYMHLHPISLLLLLTYLQGEAVIRWKERLKSLALTGVVNRDATNSRA